MKINKLLFILLIANYSFAQQVVSANLEKVTQNGLHQIEIPTQIRSVSKENLSNFRIFDSKNVEVPYFLYAYKEIQTSFEVFKIISKNQIPNKNTTIIVEISNENVTNIELEIANTNVEKQCNISGSNDQKQWFGLMTNEEFYDLKNPNSKSVLKTIVLPKSDYKYLKFEFDDKKSLPINVLQIGYTKGLFTPKTLVEIKPKSQKISENKTKKSTIITFEFDENNPIDRIDFEISNPRLYKRKATIYTNQIEIYKRKKIVVKYDLMSFDLNSSLKNSINLNFDIHFGKKFFIEIENNDNPPLTISSIKLFQKPLVIVADLEQDQTYTIEVGNPKFSYPNYDIQHFEANISNNLPETKIVEIIHQEKSVKITESKPKLVENPWFMWVCIIIGGISILYFTTKLVKDMKNNP